MLAFMAGTSAKSLLSVGLNCVWYFVCLTQWPAIFNAPTATFPWWFFVGLLVITAISGSACGFLVVAIAEKPAQRFVMVMAIVMFAATFFLTESGFVEIWIPIWVGHLRRIVLCSSFWYSARWLGLRLAVPRDSIDPGRRIAW
jgi:hypothetical protein